MKGLRIVGLALVAAGLLLGPTALADDPAKKLGEVAGKKVSYLDQLVRFDQQQIRLGNLALERSTDPRVREYANRLIKDHEANLRTLRTWAQGRALEVAALAEEPSTQGTGGSGLEQVAEAAQAESQKHEQKADEQSVKASEKLDELRREEPEKFDKAFLSHVIDSQKKGVELLKLGRDEFEGDVTFAAVLTKTQPVLEGHVAHAEALEDVLD